MASRIARPRAHPPRVRRIAAGLRWGLLAVWPGIAAMAATDPETGLETAPDEWLEAPQLLPTDWPTGSRQRFALHWQREFSTDLQIDATLGSGMNGAQHAELDLEVLEGGGEQVRLRWRPRLKAPRADPATATALWQLNLSQTLDLDLSLPKDGSLNYQVSDPQALHQQVWPQLVAVAQAQGLELDCASPTLKGSVLCQLDTPEGMAEWLLRPIEGFMFCLGLEIGADTAVAWDEPHPRPSIGAAVQMHFKRTWAPAQADGLVRIHTAATPDAEQLSAWLHSQLDPATDYPPQLLEWLAQFQIHIALDCAMDPHDGWPVTVLQTLTMGDVAQPQASESLRVQRLGRDPAH